MVRGVHEVQERFLAGAEAEERVAGGVTTTGNERDRPTEEGVSVAVELEVGLEDVEFGAVALDHAGEGALGPQGTRKVGFGRTPEIELVAQAVESGVGEGRLVTGDETVDVIPVRVAEKGVRDFFGGDADGGERGVEPTAFGVFAGAEPRVKNGDLTAELGNEDVHVEREHVGPLAAGHKIGLHGGAIRRRLHQPEALLQG